MEQGHLSHGGTRWRERERERERENGMKEPSEAIKPEGTRSKNGHRRRDCRECRSSSVRERPDYSFRYYFIQIVRFNTFWIEKRAH